MSTIRFLINQREDIGAPEVMPEIDGRPLTAIVGGSRIGLIPEFFRFGPAAAHYAPKETRVPVLGCECGEWGCDPVFVTITENGGVITWSDIDYINESFEFSSENYSEAIRAVTPFWNSPPIR